MPWSWGYDRGGGTDPYKRIDDQRVSPQEGQKSSDTMDDSLRVERLVIGGF